MSAYAEYDTAKLHPFQNGVLRLVRELSLPFCLTGGTAVSRHRLPAFMDDLSAMADDILRGQANSLFRP